MKSKKRTTIVLPNLRSVQQFLTKSTNCTMNVLRNLQNAQQTYYEIQETYNDCITKLTNRTTIALQNLRTIERLYYEIYKPHNKRTTKSKKRTTIV